MSSPALAIGVICIVVGVGFAGTGAAIAGYGARFRRRSERAQGTVIELRAVASPTSTGPVSGASGPQYRPVVEFTTVDGRRVRAESRFASNPPPARVGNPVRVFYDPNDPERIQLDTAVGRGGCLAFALILFGAVLVAIGVVVLIAAG